MTGGGPRGGGGGLQYTLYNAQMCLYPREVNPSWCVKNEPILNDFIILLIIKVFPA